jgi:hypothetical protein
LKKVAEELFDFTRICEGWVVWEVTEEKTENAMNGENHHQFWKSTGFVPLSDANNPNQG